MGRTGRPPYPDVLTPREQEVLELVRRGLSNAEIGERLGISMDGAKYHVSSILMKLGVNSRDEAARWQPEERRPWWAAAFAPLGFLRRGVSSPVFAGTIVAALLLALLAGIGLLAFLLIGTDSEAQEPVEPGLYATPRPGVVGVISDFLVLEGSEFFPAIPPCTAFDAEDASGVVTPIEIGYLPEGATELEENSWVSTCPDGEMLSTSRDFALDEQGRTLRVFWGRAPYSFPVVLGDPDRYLIDQVQVQGRDGLLLVPQPSEAGPEIATLRFWVDEQGTDLGGEQEAGAYVYIGLPADLPNVVDELMRIGESVLIAEP